MEVNYGSFGASPYCGKSYHGFIGDPPVCPNCKHLF
jgi:hypothetical protein